MTFLYSDAEVHFAAYSGSSPNTTYKEPSKGYLFKLPLNYGYLDHLFFNYFKIFRDLTGLAPLWLVFQQYFTRNYLGLGLNRVRSSLLSYSQLILKCKVNEIFHFTYIS